MLPVYGYELPGLEEFVVRDTTPKLDVRRITWARYVLNQNLVRYVDYEINTIQKVVTIFRTNTSNIQITDNPQYQFVWSPK